MTCLPYVGFVSIFSFLYLYGGNNSQRKLEAKLLSYIFFIFVVCFRWFISQDAFAYENFFHYVPNIFEAINTHFTRWSWWEPGFCYYISIYKLFTDNYLIFQIIDSSIEIFLIYKCFERYDCNNPFAIMIFFAMNGFWSFDVQRNFKAILLFFYALKFIEIERKNWKNYFLCLLIAYFFHNSSLLYFLVTPFFIIKLTEKRLKIYFYLGLLMAIYSSFFLKMFISVFHPFLPGRIGEMISSYILTKSSFSVSRFFSFGTLEKLITYILIIIYFNKLKYVKCSVIIKCYVLYFLSYFVFYSFLEVSNRLSMLFVFSYWIIYFKILGVEKRKHIKNLLFVCITFYCILKMSLYNQPHQSYNNVLFPNYMTLEERMKL